MFEANISKNRLFNLGFICLSYSILVTLLGYFSINSEVEFFKKSYIFDIYYSLDNSFGGYIIAGIWAFLDMFVILTISTFLYSISEKIVSSLDKNA